MKNVSYLIICLLSAHACNAMQETKPTQEYSQTINDLLKKLVIIKAITVNGKAPHIKVEPSESDLGIINAVVSKSDVAQQERQHTEQEFFPFYVNQAHQKVIIQPHVAGTYTIQLPSQTYFKVENPNGSISIHANCAQFERK